MSLIMIIIKRDNDFTEILDIYKTYVLLLLLL